MAVAPKHPAHINHGKRIDTNHPKLCCLGLAAIEVQSPVPVRQPQPGVRHRQGLFKG